MKRLLNEIVIFLLKIFIFFVNIFYNLFSNFGVLGFWGFGVLGGGGTIPPELRNVTDIADISV